MSKYEVPDLRFITVADMKKRYGDYDPNVFKRWQDQGEISKLRNGLYHNSSVSIDGDWDKFLIASALYEPSYISTLSAFRFYNFIPESVFSVSSVSTRKSKTFQVGRVVYSFKSIKPELFFGYKVEMWKGDSFSIATPEKALLDMAYYEPHFDDRDWIRGLRLDYDEIDNSISWDVMYKYANRIGSPTVSNRITKLLEVMDDA